MKNLSLILMTLAALSVNVTSAQAVNKQVEISVNKKSQSQGNKITTSTNIQCYWLPNGRLVCK